MSIEFKLPQLAEGIETADVAQIHVQPGDVIEANQVVMELETEKAVMDLRSPHAGKISKILVKTGDSLKVGQPVLTIEPSGGTPASRNGGATETSKAAANGGAKAPAAPAKPAASTAAPAAQLPAPVMARVHGNLPAPAGPATRRLARELGINLDSLSGSGPGGRITLEDVVRAKSGSGGGGGGIAVPPLPDFTKFGPVERQAFSKLQKTSANNLSLAWQVIPHVTQHELADITDVEAARKRYQDSLAKGGPKVTMTAIAMKAVVACLKAYPNFNASFDAAAGEIVLKRYYHIGVAVDTPSGLVVPVIRDVDQKTVIQLATELGELAEKARERRLELKDMQGGTFTITNLGGIGGTGFTPIVNYPEVAILGMSRSQQQLQLVHGQVVSRLMLPLSLSYDHRVINGADAARFIVKLSSMFSDAFRLLLEC